MAYTTNQALATLNDYLGINEAQKRPIEKTKERGFVLTLDSEEVVIFVYPLVHKQDNTKNYFDTRDSGAYERGVAWNYAITHKLKYFCIGVNDSVDKYVDYAFSLECSEKIIEKISGTLNGVRNGPGNQIIIPNDYVPIKPFERIANRLGVYIASISRSKLMNYLETYDNRPYMIDSEIIDLNDFEVSDGIVVDAREDIKNLMNLKNKEFIFACLDLMKQHNLFTSDVLALLENKDRCADLFRHNNFHGILFEVNPDQNAEDQGKDLTGDSKYYSDKYTIGNKEYYASSQWRTDREDARRPLINWIIAQLGKVKYETGYESDFAHNRIIFGAPGTGKSFTLNNEKDKLLKNGGGYERVTFHPDYSYANFVGTYKPVPCKDDDGKDAITYEYVPGPFMRTYVKALKNSRTDIIKPYLLLIEEINRANVAAVFGDVFQLLDRDQNVSEYPIRPSEDIKKHLAKAENLGGQPEDYDEIKIPDNMFIWATMNSADQGVFPMDTAFKRRWDFKYLGIDDNDKSIEGKTVILGTVASQKVEWNKLRKAINKFLANQKINEDKQLGPYFIAKRIIVPAEGNEINSKEFTETFKNKVIMYLFEDAAKQKRASLFEGCFQNSSRYSEICKEFEEKGIGIFNAEIQMAAEPEDIQNQNTTSESVMEENNK